MSDFQKMFDDFMKQGQQMADQMGAEFAKAQAQWFDAWKDYLPEGMADQFSGFIGQGIDAKTRALLTVAGLTAKGAGDREALAGAIKAARTAGATQREVTETIMQMGAVGAFDGVTKAMTIAMTVLATDGGNG